MILIDFLPIQTWDENLALTAREWASRCVFEHNPNLQQGHLLNLKFSSVGENIWTGYPPSIFNVATAMKKWNDEKEAYDYNSNTCTKICGHYTQVCLGRYVNKRCLCLMSVYGSIDAEEVLTSFVFLVFLFEFTPSLGSRLCGRTATRSAVQFSCVQMASKSFLLKKVQFSCATMLQRESNHIYNHNFYCHYQGQRHILSFSTFKLLQ